MPGLDAEATPADAAAAAADSSADSSAESGAGSDAPAAPGKYDAEIDRIFGAGGPLAPAVGSFKPRQSQTEMEIGRAHV